MRHGTRDGRRDRGQRCPGRGGRHATTTDEDQPGHGRRSSRTTAIRRRASIPASVTVTVAPAHGTTSVDPLTGAITYTPDADWSGTDTFTYQVCDTGTPALCDTAVVTVDVAAVNDAPVAADDTATTDEDQPVTVPVTGNDSDPEGALDPASVSRHGRPRPRDDQRRPAHRCDHVHARPGLVGDRHLHLPGLRHGLACPVRHGGRDRRRDRGQRCPGRGRRHRHHRRGCPGHGRRPRQRQRRGREPRSRQRQPSRSRPPTGRPASTRSPEPITYTPDANWSGTDTFTYQVCDTGTPALCDTAVVTVDRQLRSTMPRSPRTTPLRQTRDSRSRSTFSPTTTISRVRSIPPASASSAARAMVRSASTRPPGPSRTPRTRSSTDPISSPTRSATAGAPCSAPPRPSTSRSPA